MEVSPKTNPPSENHCVQSIRVTPKPELTAFLTNAREIFTQSTFNSDEIC